MSGTEFLDLATTITLVVLSIAFVLTALRVVIGPDKVKGFGKHDR